LSSPRSVNLGGVSEQVQKYLAETAGIAGQPSGHSGCDPAAEGEALGARTHTGNIERIRDDIRQVERNLFEFDLPGFDL
jgi:hypothetical protein